MGSFNLEVHHDNIRKADRVPEFEWTKVQRKLKYSSFNFIACNKNACNSKTYNADGAGGYIQSCLVIF